MLFPLSWSHLRAIDFVTPLKQSFWIPRPTWTADDIPDLTGKVVIVTGANTGVGKETAKALLAHNATVYLACRNAERAKTAIADLEQSTGKKGVFLPLDLSSLRSVKAGVDEFLSKEKDLHLLVNNAGIMFPPHSQLTEGYDAQWHTNVTGHWYLTKLLLPTLLETVKHSTPNSVRVIHVSSGAHYFLSDKPLDFGTFKGGPHRRTRSTYELYCQSKFGNIVVSNEFHRRYADQGLVSISVHPGTIDTDLYRYLDVNPIIRFGRKLSGLHPPTLGAVSQLYAGTAEEAGSYGSKFLVPWARIGKPRPETDDKQLGKEVWTWLEEQVKKVIDTPNDS